jgi:hypothetical protein
MTPSSSDHSHLLRAFGWLIIALVCAVLALAVG